MSSLAPVSASSSPSLVEMDVLRRKLPAELIAMREKIEESNLRDEMTEKIDDWQKKFFDAFKASADAERVCNTHIGLLQEILCDELTTAPLDAYAVLGNDGHTYGQMSLAVYLLSAPAMYKNRSPLDITNPDEFMIAPHPVVRHMTGWLKKHDAFLYSEELERGYLRLLPEQEPLDQEDLECIFERQKALDCIERERRSRQEKEFDEKLEKRMQAWGLEVEKLSAFKSQADNDLDLLKESDQRVFHAAQKRLDAIAAKTQEECKKADKALDRMDECQKLEYEDVKQQLDRSKDEERLAISCLKAKIAAQTQNVFTPLAQRIDACVHEAMAKIQEITRKEQQELLTFDGSIKELKREIADLQQQIDRTSCEVIVAKQEEIVLQQSIYDTRVAIQKMKKKNRDSLLSTIAVIGASVFSTWAIQAALRSTSMGAAILPARGGASLSLRISI